MIHSFVCGAESAPHFWKRKNRKSWLPCSKKSKSARLKGHKYI